MGNLAHLLAIATFVSLQAIVADATYKHTTGSKHGWNYDEDYYDWSDDSSESWTDDESESWTDDESDNDDGYGRHCGKTKCPRNEVYDVCDTPCPQRTCSFDPRVVRCAAPPKPGDPGCIVGCRCVDGYLRNDAGVCVPSNQCNTPTPGSCGRNEAWTECPQSNCSPQSCDQLGLPVPCPYIPCSGVFGCACKSGFLRNSEGVCIPSNDCPSCGGDPNAQSGCGGNCGKKCSDLGKTGPQICPLSCRLNGCDCKPGYYFDDVKKRCVLPSQCSTTPTCRANEVLSTCANGGCRRRKCIDLDKPILCIDPLVCEPGCICADGYYQDSNGQCVSEEQCKAQTQCPTNEVYDECENGCERNARYCNHDPRVVKCAPAPKRAGCLGCRCADGYLRNDADVCVLKEECASCRGDKNAKHGCGTYCGKRCSDVGKPGPFVCTTECQYNGCDCKDGYYYDEEKQRCVKPHDCTKSTTTTCGADEVLVECPISRCNVQTCDQLGFEVACPAIACSGVFGCICKDGYLRNSDGVCIPQDQCPGCGEDPNAVPGCGVYCGTKCSDVGKSGPFACPKICRIGGCDCKKGYFYDSNEKKCVLPGQCNNQSPDEDRCGDVESKTSQLVQGNYRLCGKFLYQTMKANPGASVVTSAFSLLTPLAQLCYYSKGVTASEIYDILNVKTKEDIRCAFPSLLDSIKAAEGTELNLGAKVYVKKGYSLSKSFNDIAKRIFRAEGESIDFKKADQAAKTINKWVSDATKGKITDLVSPSMFDSLTRLVLANAVYFKGGWQTEFNVKNTKKADFYVNSKKTSKVDMMQRTGKIDYYQHSDLDAQAVSLPYKDGNFTFVVILPNKKDGLENLVTKLQDGDIIGRAMGTFRAENVNLYIPKFEISTKIDLIDVLSKIGVKTIFTSRAQLDGMIKPNEPLYVSSAVQKATITVDEKGAVAAAANAFVGAKLTSARPPRKQIIFRADHPFVYCIKARKVPLFCGIKY